ncbi:triple functional domain protein-like [Stigmatopora argus]
MEHLASEVAAKAEILLQEYLPEPNAVSEEGQGSLLCQTPLDLLRECAESTASHWIQLLRKTDGKMKLLLASLAFHETSTEVCRMLEHLEGDYKREEDWCKAENAFDSSSQMDHLTCMSSKHLAQKDVFLKACTLARGIADIFHQYMERNSASMGILSPDEEQCVTDICNDLKERENHVLHLWAIKKQRLEQCQQYVAFERQAKEAQDKMKDTLELYLSIHCPDGLSFRYRQEVLKELEDFDIITKHLEDSVKLLIKLADSYCRKGHSHASAIRKCVMAADKCYQDFTLQMAKPPCSPEKNVEPDIIPASWHSKTGDDIHKLSKKEKSPLRKRLHKWFISCM